eukprot:4790504-Prymnesium_polylepis.1
MSSLNNGYLKKNRELVESALGRALEKLYAEEPADPLAFLGQHFISVSSQEPGSVKDETQDMTSY